MTWIVKGPATWAASGWGPFGAVVTFGGTALPGNEGATSSARAEATKVSKKAALFMVRGILARFGVKRVALC